MKEVNKKQNQIAGTIMTLLGAGFWGLCAVVSKYLMVDKGLDSMWLVDFRMFSAGVITLCLAKITNARSKDSEGSSSGIFEIWKDRKSVVRLLVIAFLAFGACQLTYFLAIEYCDAAIATALQQTAPVFVLAFAVIKEHRMPRPAEIIVLAMVIFGSFMLATGGNIHKLAIPVMAIVCGLCSALTCALYITLPAPLINRYGTFETVGWGLTIGGIALSPICRLWNVPSSFDIGIILGLFFIVVFGAVMAFALYLYGTTIIGPVKAGIYGLFEPVIATLASVLWLKETFTGTDYIGIIAILAGIVILTLSKNKITEKLKKS